MTLQNQIVKQQTSSQKTLEGGGIPLPDKPPYRNLETAAGIYTGLAELPFLKRMVDHGVPKPFIYILLQHCYVKKVPKGQVLAEAGEHPDNMGSGVGIAVGLGLEWGVQAFGEDRFTKGGALIRLGELSRVQVTEVERYLVLEGFLAVHPPRTGKEGSSRPVVKAPEREVTEKKLNWRKSMKKVAEENAKKAGKTTFSPRSLTELTAKARDLQPITLGPGNCWGERAFMFGDDYSNSAYANATGDCDVLVFPFEEYQATLCRIGIATGLQNTPQLARIMGSQHVSIAQACQIEVYDEGDTLFKQGDKGDCCYIITGGSGDTRRCDGACSCCHTCRKQMYQKSNPRQEKLKPPQAPAEVDNPNNPNAISQNDVTELLGLNDIELPESLEESAPPAARVSRGAVTPRNIGSTNLSLVQLTPRNHTEPAQKSARGEQ
eukprot:gene9211-10917_t